jgi:hypothetical protein
MTQEHYETRAPCIILHQIQTLMVYRVHQTINVKFEHFSVLSLLYFGTVPIVWYFFSFIPYMVLVRERHGMDVNEHDIRKGIQL